MPPKPSSVNFFDNFNTTTTAPPTLPPKNTGHITNVNSVFNNNNASAFNQNQSRPVDPFFGLTNPNPQVNNNNNNNVNSNPFLNLPNNNNPNNNMANNYGTFDFYKQMSLTIE